MQKIRFSTFFRHALWAMLFIQVLFLGVVSLRGGANFIDGDTGRLYQHMVAIWEQGTLFPDGWIYPTTMELDCSLLLALPFYGLTHNAVLAFWCANMIWIVLWICLIVLLAHRLQIRTLAPLAALLVLTPYSCANLYYWNMMFLNASQYAWKVMLPLLLIYLLLEPHPEHPSRRAWFLLLLYEAGLYTTSLSSGVYVAAMGIAPLLILFFLGWLHQKESLTLYTGLCSLGSVAVTLAGVLTSHLLGIHISGGQMIFNSITTFSENAANCFVGFLRLFGAVTRDQTSVTRLAGMAQLLCWVLALAMLGAAVWVVAGIFRRKLSWTERGCWYLAAPALWNFCLLFMLDTTYGDPYFEVRYHLMGGVPLLILVTLLAEKYFSHPLVRVQFVRRWGILAFTALLVVLCDRRAYCVYWPTDGVSAINAKEQRLCSEIDLLPVHDVFVVQSSSTPEICGALDDAHTYKLLWLESDRCYLKTFDGPMANTDAKPDIGPAALVLTKEYTLEDLPAYLQAATPAAETDDYTIYLLQNGSLPDGIVGLPYAGETGLDYANSDGYEYQGIVDENRCLSTAGYTGTVLHSPDLSLAQTTDITLTWGEESLADGMVSILQGDRVVAQQEISSGVQTTILTDIPAGEGYTLTVETASDAGLVLQSILFTAN